MDLPITEQRHSASPHLDRIPTLELLAIMNGADAEVAAAVARELPRIARAVDAISHAMDQGGRLYYVGAGTSGRLGVLDAAECPPTFCVPADRVRAVIAGGEAALTRAVEGAEDDAEAGASDLLAAGFASGDAFVGIAAGGRTPYVIGAAKAARKSGAVTCSLCCTPDAPLSREVEYPMEPAPGPEVLTGSTRLRAGTATKMVLNMISTSVMVKLGHVYGNLMVNVAPTNRKLEDRARRIIAEAAGVSTERAAELLETSGRSVRVAIVMARRGVGRGEAERLLAAVGGRIDEALREQNG